MLDNIALLTEKLSSSFVHHLIMNYGADSIYGAFLNTLINRYPDRLNHFFKNTLSTKCYVSSEAIIDFTKISKAVIKEKNIINLLSTDDSVIANINLNPWGSFVVGNVCLVYEKPIFRFEVPMNSCNIHFEEFNFTDIIPYFEKYFQKHNTDNEDYYLIKSFILHNKQLSEIFVSYDDIYSHLNYYSKIFTFRNEELERALLLEDFKINALSFFIDDFESILSKKMDSIEIVSFLQKNGKILTDRSPINFYSKINGFSSHYIFSIKSENTCIDLNIGFSSASINLSIEIEFYDINNQRKIKNRFKKVITQIKKKHNNEMLNDFLSNSNGLKITDKISIENILETISLFCIYSIIDIIEYID